MNIYVWLAPPHCKPILRVLYVGRLVSITSRSAYRTTQNWNHLPRPAGSTKQGGGGLDTGNDIDAEHVGIPIASCAALGTGLIRENISLPKKRENGTRVHMDKNDETRAYALSLPPHLHRCSNTISTYAAQTSFSLAHLPKQPCVLLQSLGDISDKNEKMRWNNEGRGG